MSDQKPHEKFRDHRPRIGDVVTQANKEIGTVSAVEGNLCWIRPGGGAFIWCFRDGLNALHQWPTKEGGKLARCPGLPQAAPETARPAVLFVINDPTTGLYWSNEQGWIDFDKATISRFTPEERNTLDLPLGGIWTTIH